MNEDLATMIAKKYLKAFMKKPIVHHK